MKVIVSKTPQELGAAAARHIAAKLREAIAARGEARLALSTGMSQFETIAALIQEDVDWGKVTMFHLDEYVNLPESHPASFRGYLKERFTSDRLILIPSYPTAAMDALAKQGTVYAKRHGLLEVKLQNAFEALPIINSVRPYIRDFEVLSGTMDDAFIQITGKEIRQ